MWLCNLLSSFAKSRIELYFVHWVSLCYKCNSSETCVAAALRDKLLKQLHRATEEFLSLKEASDDWADFAWIWKTHGANAVKIWQGTSNFYKRPGRGKHAQGPELFTAITSVCCTGIGDVGYGSNDEKSEDNASSTGSSKQGSRPVSAQAWVAASDPLFNIGIDEVSLSLSYFIPQHGIHRKYRWN